MNNLPSGTVTFLFTDIEGSTQPAEHLFDAVQFNCGHITASPSPE
jgi:hypothetical protein